MRKSARFHVGRCCLSTQSLSVRLQDSVRFLRTPMPAPPTAFLTVSLSAWTTIRVSLVPRRSQEWFRFCLSAGSVCVRAAPFKKGQSRYVPFWAGPVSVFWPVKVTTFISSSHMLTMPSSLAPHPPRHWQMHIDLTALTWLSPGYFVPVASHQIVTNLACTGRLRATACPVSCRHPSAIKQRTTRPQVAA